MSLNIEITEPTEGATWAGYWTVELTVDGEVLVDGAVSPDLVEEFDAVELLRGMLAAAEANR